MELNETFIPSEMIKEILDRLEDVCYLRLRGLRRVCKLIDFLILASPTTFCIYPGDHLTHCPEKKYWEERKRQMNSLASWSGEKKNFYKE